MLPADAPPIEWPRPLVRRWGGRQLLEGIEIWYDFDWQVVLDHNRSVFPNCKSIRRKIHQLTTPGAVPILLLTQGDDGPSYRVMQAADGRVVHILDIDSVLAVSVDAADTLLGHRAVPDIDLDSALNRLEQAPRALQALVAEHLDASAVLTWMGHDDERLRELSRVVSAIDVEELGRVVAAAFTILARAGESPHVLQEYSSEAEGDLLRLAAAGATYAEQSAAVQRLEALLEDDHIEAIYQQFLEENSWMFGARFVGRWPGRQITLGDQQDFILRTADGFFDLIELKRPSHQVLLWDEGHQSYYPSATLSAAIGQVLKYLLDVDNDLHRIRSEFDIDVHRARAVVVIGRANPADQRFQQGLRNLNAHLNRVEVWTYTQLLSMARAILGHTESRLEGRST